jgi:outer membrane protein OmpA-like peptidoglycan-associated protein
MPGTKFDITKAEGDGFKAEYYNGSNFETKVFTRVEKTIDFALYSRSPDPRIDPGYFSIRWTGKVYAPETGTYTFIFVADDGVRLWVNKKLIIDRWFLNRATAFTGQIELTGTQVYDIKIEYSQMKPSAAVARASWAFEKGPEQPFNPRYVFSSPEKLTPITTQKKTTPVAVAAKKPAPVRTEIKPVAKKVVPKPAENDANDEVEVPVSTKKEIAKPAVEKPATPVVEVKKEEAPRETFENLEAGKSIVLNHIFFDQSKHELRPESFGELDKLANTLQKYPGIKIAITGHTDNVGDFNLNVQLSRDRAKAVADYLVAKGISSDRLEYKGFGGLYPVSPNTTEESKKKNRRVEFVVK